MTEVGLNAILTALTLTNRSVKYLRLPLFTADSAYKLTRMVAKNPGLAYLFIDGGLQNCNDFPEFVAALGQNSALKHVDLGILTTEQLATVRKIDDKRISA